MAKKGKKYLEAAKLVDSSSLYSVVEAIELAKLYSDDRARKFINGILSNILAELKANANGDVKPVETVDIDTIEESETDLGSE